MTTDVRSAYMTASISTAGPAQLLVMLCERLVLDVERALQSMRSGGAIEETNRHLVHAQDIVIELRSSLRVEDWDGGPGLASIYDFVHLSLVRANVTKDAALVADTLALVDDLCRTWREAALTSVGAA